MDGIAKGRHGKKPRPVHQTDGLRIYFGAADAGPGIFELGASSAAVDGLKGGGYAHAVGATLEGARNLAHEAKICEAQEYLRQQNAQKQQQRLGLAHPPQLQHQPPPPPPPPPNKCGLAEMAEGDPQHGGLPPSVQQAQLCLSEAGQEPLEESVSLRADGGRYELPVPLENKVGGAADSCVFKDKSDQKTLLTPRYATPSVTASSAPVAAGAKGVARVHHSECVGMCGDTHTYMHARTRTL